MDQNQILARLDELETSFLNKTMDKDQIAKSFNQYITNENMQDSIVSEKIIALLNMGIADQRHNEKLFEYGKYKFMVDVELYDLISLLYELRIHTLYSCQGDKRNKGYISFKNKRSLTRFTKVCKAMHLIEVDFITTSQISIFSIRFNNTDISLIYNSIKISS